MSPRLTPLPLAVYVGQDVSVVRSLTLCLEPAPRIEIDTADALKKGHPASIIIVDCRAGLRAETHRATRGTPCIALVGVSAFDRERLFAFGYSDFLFWPLIQTEVIRRVDSCLSQLERYHAIPLFAIDPVVQTACDLMTRTLTTTLSLQDVARLSGTNRTTLVDRFQTCFGCGPMTWLRHHRLAEAAKLLRSDFQTVTQIAHAVGYESPNNFSTAFKAVHGVSPLQYRKMALRREKPV